MWKLQSAHYCAFEDARGYFLPNNIWFSNNLWLFSKYSSFFYGRLFSLPRERASISQLKRIIFIENNSICQVARDYVHSRFPSMRVLQGIYSPASSAYSKPGLLPDHHRIAMLKKVGHSDQGCSTIKQSHVAWCQDRKLQGSTIVSLCSLLGPKKAL